MGQKPRGIHEDADPERGDLRQDDGRGNERAQDRGQRDAPQVVDARMTPIPLQTHHPVGDRPTVSMSTRSHGRAR